MRGPSVVLAQGFRNTENEWPIMPLDIVSGLKKDSKLTLIGFRLSC